MDIDAIKAKWLQYLHQQGKSQHTLKVYERGLNHFIRWHEKAYEQPFEVDAVMPGDIREWKAYQQIEERAKLNTVTAIDRSGRFFHWARRENHCEDVGGLRLDGRKPKALSLSNSGICSGQHEKTCGILQSSNSWQEQEFVWVNYWR